MYIRRLLGAGTFLLGLILILVLSSAVFRPKNNTEEAGIEDVFANAFLGEPEDTIDVVVIGDSYSYTTVFPLQAWKTDGFTLYDCGTNEQTLDYTMVMLRRFFRHQSPKVVVLETNPIYHDITRFELMLEKLETWFPVFLYHDRWKKTLGKEDFYKQPEYTFTKSYKGARYFTKIRPVPELDETRWNAADEAEPIVPLCRHYVRRIRDYCEDRGARLVLLSAPNEMYWDAAKHNGIQRLSEELGCDYIDMNYENDKIGIDWSHDTVDKGDHLNHAGAVKATRYLSEYLASLGILEDHREDPAYIRWNKWLERYEDEVRRESI